MRTEGFDDQIVLIGEETERPYERPMLSKEYLRGDKPAAKLYVHEEGFYEQNDSQVQRANMGNPRATTPTTTSSC